MDGTLTAFRPLNFHRQRQLAIGGCRDGSPVKACTYQESVYAGCDHSHKELLLVMFPFQGLRTRWWEPKKRLSQPVAAHDEAISPSQGDTCKSDGWSYFQELEKSK